MTGPTEMAAWLCFLVPLACSPLAYPLEKAHRDLPSVLGVLASLVSLLSAALMLAGWPAEPVELRSSWLWGPGMPFCLLIDPLSTAMAFVVALVCSLIMFYSAIYMRGEPGPGRYWSLMCLFTGSMLMLVLAGDLITLLVGWKLVGFCSYALISHYYTDEPERWVGGPPPEPMYPPSHCGLKALLTVFTGDVMFFSAVFIIYAYSGTFVLTELYRTARVWLVSLAGTPGMLALTAVLLMGGPLSKSAQFPFHEWLPEAMAGPTPVSALIHAATMVKAGVYVVARFLPIFYVGFHYLGLSGAGIFFLLAAYLGAITAFLGAAQGCVALELKKVLAYSTMSQLGYLMLGLGVAGLTPGLPASAATSAATFYHLIAHAFFKSALFMMAGIAIHTFGTIYMEEMGGLKRITKAMWALTLILALSLIGIPPFSGFWGKDLIIGSGLALGLWGPFLLALLTVPLTAFYTIRMFGMVFYGDPKSGGHEGVEAKLLLLGPLAVLAILSLALGAAGPLIISGLADGFRSMMASYVGVHTTASYGPGYYWPGILTEMAEHIPSLSCSLALAVLSCLASYALYVRGQPRPEVFLAKWPWLVKVRRLLRARLGINGLYYALANAVLKTAPAVRTFEAALDGFINGGIPYVVIKHRPTVRTFETGMDVALNVGIPRFFRQIASAIRKIQTGNLGYNVTYISVFLALFTGLLALSVIL